VTDELVLLAGQTLLIAVPLVLAALGGVLSERAGVVNIALEGTLVAGAFAAAVVGQASGSVAAGVVAALAAGLAVAALHAVLAVRLGVDQVVSGLALNLLAAGVTEYGAHVVWPADARRDLPAMLALEPTGLGLLDLVLGRPLVLATALLVPLVATLAGRTALGLRLHAVGESPAAAETLGVSVARTRALGLALAGLLAGLGGAWLAFDVGQFQHGMSAGKGYIAMAAVVSGRWRPLGATAACLLFAASEALVAALERRDLDLPGELIATLPYVLTMVALVGVVGRARAPAALGTFYRRADHG
jgi:ABC-type uncharacterized transport system permease subunit